MKHVIGKCVAVIVVTVLLTSSALAAEASVAKKKRGRSSEVEEEAAVQTGSMTVWQARRAIITGLTTVMSKMEFTWGAGYKVNVHPESIRVSAASIDCTADVSTWGFNTKPDPHTEVCGIDLKSIGTLGVKRYRRQYQLTRESGAGFELMGNLAWATPDEAQAFADAVNRLRSAARGKDMEMNGAVGPDFQQQAAAWRALPTKPAISEEVRRHRLLAENAVKEKQFDVAIEEYEAGLAINPLWPEGHFNAALLSGELGYHSMAIQHMQAYLDLVPDASDAQGARDQIVIWQAKQSDTRGRMVPTGPSIEAGRAKRSK